MEGKNYMALSIMIIALLGFLFDGYDLLIYSYTLPQIMAYYRATALQMGLVGTIMLAGTIIGAIAFGMVSDFVGKRLALILTISFYSISTIFTIYSPDISIFALFRFLSSLGIGGEWGIGYSIITEYFKSRKGFSGGILQSGFSIGAVLAIFVSVYFIMHYGLTGWKYVFISGGIPALLVIPIRLFIPENKNRNQNIDKIKIFMETKIFLLSLILTFGEFFMAYATIIWWPTILENIYKINPGSFSEIMIFATIIQVPILFFIGYLVDVVGKKKVALMFSLLTLISLIFWLFAMKYTGIPSKNLWTWPVMEGYILFQATSLFVGVFGIWFSTIFNPKIKATLSNFSYMFGRGVGGGLASSAVVLLMEYTMTPLQFSMIYIAIVGAIIAITGIIMLPEKRSWEEGNPS
ncbi:MAG: MFS transporter [Thermoplasmata archaeon]